MQNRGGPSPDETRNMFIAIGLSLAIFLGFEIFYNGPQRERQAAAERARVEAQVEAQRQQGGVPAAPAAPQTRDQTLAATAAARVPIQANAVDGSISLMGARFDDLSLRTYRRTLDNNSPEVTLLSPMGAAFGHDAFFGWEQQSGENAITLAGADLAWTAPQGARLTPQTPVTLTRDAGNGVVMQRTISIDDEYMISMTDTVRNNGAAAVSVRPFGTVRREGKPQDYRHNQIVHQGMIGVFGDSQLRQVTFERADTHARDKERGNKGPDEKIEEEQAQHGWFGITEHYWLTAIVPDQNERYAAYFDSRQANDTTDYRAAYRGQWREIPPGASITYTQRLFAGAKRLDLLQSYQNSETSQPIPRFDDAIDWGHFWFLTRPYFWLMHWLQQLVGNFGIAILLTTVVVKAILFPIVYHSFKSMAKMRALQPKMKELQERYAADKQRQQQELMKLYQTEKINPVSGCLPMLLQIPVLYALYKTLSVTIEMRHTPFYGWIHDLSARDPTSIFNLFGLLPYDPASIPVIGSYLMIGAWPVLYGISMWLSQKMSPPIGDPTQAKIFQFMPVIFTVLFASYPAGLAIYWTWSNVLSMLQQYVIMRRQGVETQLDTFLKKRFGRGAAAAE